MGIRPQEDNPEKWHLPHLGQRIVKTTVAVFLCLLYYCLRGYRGQDMPTEAAITAIICMQPYVRSSGDYALSRMAGTLMGTFWGLMLLLVLTVFPVLGEKLFLLYGLMALGTLLSLYTAVLFRRPDASGLAAIVFLCIVIAFPDIENPLRQTGDRIFGVLLGTFAAITVNVFRLPRSKNRDMVFFVRSKDLAPDRFSQIPAAALFRLNYLYQDGAKICLMSEHAPAFFALQMNDAMLSVPLIVMDGAAIYDAGENRYLYTENIAANHSVRLRDYLDRLGISYFIYTVHNNKTCIFHQGEVRPPEERIFHRMKRSPYRSYLDEEIYEPEEIVYFKIIDEDSRVRELAEHLQSFVRGLKLRSAVRPQAGAPGLSGLYLYSGKASMKNAERRLMQMLWEKEPGLKPREIFLEDGYHSEHDAMHLLSMLGNAYEPVKLFHRKK